MLSVTMVPKTEEARFQWLNPGILLPPINQQVPNRNDPAGREQPGRSFFCSCGLFNAERASFHSTAAANCG
jgi:hypothetical protein